MGLGEAVSAVLSKYAGFEGRARRAELWYWILAIILAEIAIVIVGSVLAMVSDSLSIITMILYFGLLLGTFLPSLAVQVRRLHDTNHSGWWILINMVPFGFILLLVWFCTPGTQGSNQFGSDPLSA